jgi:hypothetical protein
MYPGRWDEEDVDSDARFVERWRNTHVQLKNLLIYKEIQLFVFF